MNENNETQGHGARPCGAQLFESSSISRRFGVGDLASPKRRGGSRPEPIGARAEALTQVFPYV